MEEQKFNTEAKQGVKANDFERKVIAFVGRNSVYYIRAFRKIEEGYTSWNWAAFFFNWFWLGYRKMIKEAIIIFVITGIIGFVAGIVAGSYGLIKNKETFIAYMDTIGLITWLILALFLGFYGNSLYYRHVKRKIMEIEALGLDAQSENAALMKEGGTSLLYALLLLLIDVVTSVIAYALISE